MIKRFNHYINEAIANRYKTFWERKISKFDLYGVYSFLTALCDDSPDCTVEFVYMVGDDLSIMSPLLMRKRAIMKDKTQITPSGTLNTIKNSDQDFSKVDYDSMCQLIQINRAKNHLTTDKFYIILDYLLRHDCDLYIKVSLSFTRTKSDVEKHKNALALIEHYKEFFNILSKDSILPLGSHIGDGRKITIMI